MEEKESQHHVEQLIQEPRESNEGEFEVLVKKLERFSTKPWFKEFLRAVMVPTLLMAENWDKMMSRLQKHVSQEKGEKPNAD